MPRGGAGRSLTHMGDEEGALRGTPATGRRGQERGLLVQRPGMCVLASLRDASAL